MAGTCAAQGWPGWADEAFGSSDSGFDRRRQGKQSATEREKPAKSAKAETGQALQ